MAESFDWYRLKFFESAENIKRLLSDAPRKISSKTAKDITVCLSQGRLFFEAAAHANIEIRPLLLFYGMVGFARAIDMVRRLKGIETLPTSHGLKVDKSGAKISDLSVKFDGRGTFQAFNDSISTIQSIRDCGDAEYSPIYIATSKSDQLLDKKISLKEILSRIPGLEKLYFDTYKEPPLVCWANLVSLPFVKEGCFNFVIHLDRQFFDASDKPTNLHCIVEDLRSKFLFLKSWRFNMFETTSSELVLTFTNVSPADSAEFEFFSGEVTAFASRHEDQLIAFSPIVEVKSILGPVGRLSSTNTKWCYLIQPFGDLYIAEMSLYYLAMFALSSLVRYHPEKWVHAISGSAYDRRPADDSVLAIIERFMNISLTDFPEMVLLAIKSPFF